MPPQDDPKTTHFGFQSVPEADKAARHASNRAASAGSEIAKIPAAINPALAAPAAPIAMVATG